MRRVLLAVLVILLSASGFADIKIKTRNKLAGQAMDSTVYIKGARQRSEMMGMTTILQCDLRQTVQLNDRTKMYMVTPLGAEEEETAAPPQAKPAPARGRKGGVITLTTTLADTGERKQMFGYEARHIKSSMSSESSPDACNKAKMRMETDGWYADLSPGLSCTATPGMGMGGGGHERPECEDAMRMRRSGKGKLGYPLQATTTMYDDRGRATSMTTETVELSNANLDAKLFEAPAGYRVARSYMELMGMGDMGAMMSRAMREAAQQGGEVDEEQLAASMAAAGSAPSPPTAASAPQPAQPASPVMAPKSAGSVRVGVVAINDKTGRGMPTDNLREKLMAEIRALNMDAVPLDSTSPDQQMLEAREKSADYIIYTDVAALAEPGQPLNTATTKREPSPTDYHAQLNVKLVSVARPSPLRLDTFITTSAPERDVDAVGEGISAEAEAVTEEIRNPKPKGATPAAKPKKKS